MGKNSLFAWEYRALVSIARISRLGQLSPEDRLFLVEMLEPLGESSGMDPARAIRLAASFLGCQAPCASELSTLKMIAAAAGVETYSFDPKTRRSFTRPKEARGGGRRKTTRGEKMP